MPLMRWVVMAVVAAAVSLITPGVDGYNVR